MSDNEPQIVLSEADLREQFDAAVKVHKTSSDLWTVGEAVRLIGDLTGREEFTRVGNLMHEKVKQLREDADYLLSLLRKVSR